MSCAWEQVVDYRRICAEHADLVRSELPVLMNTRHKLEGPRAVLGCVLPRGGVVGVSSK